MDQYIRSPQQLQECGSAVRFAQIKPRAAFSQRYIRDHSWLVPCGRIYAKHVGPETGEKTRCHGTGKDACQIEDTDAFKWTHGCREMKRISAIGGRVSLDQGLPNDGLSLRVRLPLRERPHHRCAAPYFR